MNQDLVSKIREAVIDMMAQVKISEDHIYTRTIDGAWLQGVSEVSSIIPMDWLSAWGAKECAKALGYSDYPEDVTVAEEVLKKIKACEDIKDYIKILKEAKGASFRKSKQALIDGKAGHAWLEEYVKAKIRNGAIPELPTGLLERPIKQFIEWEQENIDYWILSEARVASPEKEFAGTLDGMAMMKTGKLAIIDFKFASHIAFEHHLQTAGYQYPFEKYGIQIDQRIIIRLPKTLEKEEWDKKNYKYYKVPNNIEVRIVFTPYEMDRDAFIAALPVKRWINYIKNNYKE